MKNLVPVLLMLLVLPICLESQTKTGTTIGQFLLIEPSPRVASMGGAGVSSMQEAFDAYYNPGALGRLKHTDIQFAHNTWYAGIGLNYAQIAIKIGESSSALLSLTQLGSGDIDVRTVEQPLGTGERYTVSDLALGVGYGFRVTDRFSCGALVNYVEERIWHSSVAAMGVNLGTLYELSPDGMRIGASISNFGSRNRFSGTDLRLRYDIDPGRYGDNSSVPAELETDDFGLPIIFRVGMAYPVWLDDQNLLTLAIDAFHPNDNSESMSIGAEYAWTELVAFRVGYQNLFMQDSEVGLTAGAGLTLEKLGYDVRLDYAWASHERLGDTQRIGVSFAF
ncbi:MAG: PorV/PorQ family protein [Bacteroidota bacterium]